MQNCFEETVKAIDLPRLGKPKRVTELTETESSHTAVPLITQNADFTIPKVIKWKWKHYKVYYCYGIAIILSNKTPPFSKTYCDKEHIRFSKIHTGCRRDIRKIHKNLMFSGSISLKAI